MNLAISPGSDGDSLISRLDDIERTVRVAATRGVKLVCFPEWFLGVETVKDFEGLRDELSDLAEEHGCAIVTGNILTGDPENKVSERVLAIETDGQILLDEWKVTPYQIEEHNYSSGDGLNSCDFSFGKTVILNGLDVIDSELLGRVKSLAPRLVVLQLNPSSALEAEALHELAISLSQVLRTVVCVPILGGPGFIANDGAIANEVISGISAHGDEESERVLLEVEIDFDSSDPIPVMGTTIELPELLKQRYLSEMAGGNLLADLEKRR